MNTTPITREQFAIEEQKASRKRLDEFLNSIAKSTKKLAQHVKSEWFGRPDEELKRMVEYGHAIEEIKDSRGYRLIITQTEREIEWAREQLELGKLDASELRNYLRSLRFVKAFILTVERNADISSKVLAGRAEGIGRDTFVGSVANDRSGNN